MKRLSCTCSNYSDLKAKRKSISRRIQETKTLKKALTLISKHIDGETSLYLCEDCGQYWQGSRAWNWGNHEYLFKVPETQVAEWKDEPYVQPDELIDYIGAMQYFMANLLLENTTCKCKADGCDRKAIKLSAFCLDPSY